MAEQTKDAVQFRADRLPTLEFMKPDNVLSHLEIRTGMTIADLGSGNGYMTLPAARLVGGQGLVYAVDILKHQLSSIKGQAQLYGLPNIVTVWADLEVPGSTKIPNATADVSLLFNSLFQQKDRSAAIREAVRITKAGGVVAVTEWADQKLGMGPDKKLLVSDEEVKSIAEKEGLKLIEEHEVDDFHYLLEFKRP